MDLATTEKRELTAEENAKVDLIHVDVDKLLAEAEVEEKRAAKQSELNAGFHTPEQSASRRPDLENAANTGKSENPRASKKYSEAFASYLRHGEDRMPIEQRATLQQDNDIGGGFFATSETLLLSILKTADNILPIRNLATVYQVNRGGTLGQVTLDGDITAFSFGEAGELTTAVEDTGLAFGKRELRPRDLKRKLIKISKALLENSQINVEQVVSDRVGYALAQGLDAAYCVGSGASGPLGLFTAHADGISTGRDVVTGSATGITADGLIDIQGTLKDQYDTNARWLFNREAITLIRKLKDGDQQYIWQPGLALGTQSTILGKPFIKGDNVPHVFTNGLYVGMYGDFSYYWIVDATSMSVQRLIETYALTGQIGLLFDNMAADAMPVLEEAFVRAKCGV